MMSTPQAKIKGIMVYLIPSLLSTALPFITLPIITRFLSPREFGISALAMSTTLIIISFVSCSVDSAAQRYYFEYRKNRKDLEALIGTSTIFLLTAMAISMLPVYILSGVIARSILGSAEYSFAVFISYINSCLVVMVNFYLLLYRNMEKARYYSFYKTAQVFINAVFAITLVAVFRLGYMGLIYAALISSLLPFAALFISFIRDYKLSFNPGILVETVKFGIQFLPNAFTGSIYQFFDKYMLRSLISLSSAGIFSLAQNVASRLFIFMTAVQSVFDPLFMKDMFDKGSSGAASVGRNFTIFTYISLSAILAAILFGEEVIYLLAPSSYYEAINVFMILLSSVAVQAFAKLAGSQFAYAKRAYLSFPLSIITLVINVSLNLLFIPLWQASGAALATTISVFCLCAMYIWISQKCYRVIYERDILVMIYAAVFLSTIFLIYLRNSDAPIWLKYGVKTASLAAYIAIGAKAGILTKRNAGIVMQILKKERV